MSSASTVSTLDGNALRIVATARSHFFLHGFRGVTMDDLAAELGISKKTFYTHFRSKRDLLCAVIQQKLAELREDMTALEATSPLDFTKALHRLLDCVHRHGHEVTPSFARDLSREEPELFAMIKAERRALIESTFTKIIRSGQNARAIRDDVTVEFLTEMLILLVDAMVTPQRVAAKGIGPDELFCSILSVMLHGILTDKGRKDL